MYSTAGEGGPAPLREGLWYRLRVRLAHRRPDADEVIAHRVRAALVPTLAYPGALTVCVRGGHVVLRGAVVKDESERLVERAAKVRGVVSVESRVDASVSEEVPAFLERTRCRRLMLHPTWLAYLGLVTLALGGATAGVLGVRGRRTPSLSLRLWQRLKARR